MALIVQKYGGTSVGTVERIHRVAERVERAQKDGHQVVVVLSAMSGAALKESLGQSMPLIVADRGCSLIGKLIGWDKSKSS